MSPVMEMETIIVPEYKVVQDVVDHELQRALNRYARDGWKLNTIVRGAGAWTLVLGPKDVEVVVEVKPEKKP